MTDKVVNWEGRIRFPISSQKARPAWEQEALQAGLEKGVGAMNQLRFQCRIAQDGQEFFKSIDINGVSYTMNPKSKAQFGRSNSSGLPYLSVGLIEEGTGTRYHLHWEGDAVPLKLQQSAVSHDEGRAVKAATVLLDLSRATVTRKAQKVQARRDRNKDADGVRYDKRKREFHRLCRDDIPTKNERSRG